MTALRSFAILLRQHRHNAVLTLEQLSEGSGVSVRAISNMELGHSRGPQRKTLELIADALGLEAQDRHELLTAADAGRRRVFAPAPALLAMPRGINDFVGRASEAQFLTGLSTSQLAGPAPVVVVSGSPGVGKTSFAVHAAEALSESFPDGQFFLDLRGLDQHPLEPGVILGRLITAIAPGQRDVPHDEDERAGLFRTLVLDRRVVIVLDNAADEAQVRILLPGAGASMVIITSRRRLTGLETAHRLSLVPLTQVYAVQMLTNLMGAQAARDRAAVQHLAELGGNLPLALRLIGNRLASHEGASSARFVQRLSDEGRRLDTLTAGDMRISAVFVSSYVQLSAAAQKVFRRLSLIPAEDTGPAMAAALAGTSLEATESALDELVEYGLLQSRFTDRYRLHDLIRLFARGRLSEEESPADIAATRERVERWLLSTAIVAGRWFEPGFGSLPADWDDRVPMESAEAAQLWIESEADNWLAGLRTASTGHRFASVVDVAESMHWFSDRWPHWGHWTEVFTIAGAAAQALDDPSIAATQLNYLSWALNICDGDSAAATAVAQRAYAAAESAGDLRQQGWARYYQAWAQYNAGDVAAAVAASQESARMCERAHDTDGLSQALGMVARGHEVLGHTEQALVVHHRRLALVADEVSPPSQVVALATEMSTRTSMGRIYVNARKWDSAVQVLQPALSLGDAVAIPGMQALARAGLGEALCETGQQRAGLEHLEAAEALYRLLDSEPDAARVAALIHKHALN